MKKYLFTVVAVAAASLFSCLLQREAKAQVCGSGSAATFWNTSDSNWVREDNKTGDVYFHGSTDAGLGASAWEKMYVCQTSGTYYANFIYTGTTPVTSTVSSDLSVSGYEDYGTSASCDSSASCGSISLFGIANGPYPFHTYSSNGTASGTITAMNPGQLQQSPVVNMNANAYYYDIN